MNDIKELNRLTPCTLFKINSPIWGGGKKCVGLARDRITKNNEIEFTYVRKSDGQKSIPDHYYFDGDLLKDIDFEIQAVKGTYLVIIPFEYLNKLMRVTR